MEQVRIRVVVQAADPITDAGLVSSLESCAGVVVLSTERRTEADVVVVAADRLTSEVVSVLRRAAAETGTPVVLIANELTQADLLAAVECRVVAVLPRIAATGDRLAGAVQVAAAGGGALPSTLQGELLRYVERLQRDVLTPLGLTGSGLTPREIDVLALMADGLDTEEIAAKLCYSERTVKNVIYGVTTRLNLRNRPHAVAYALRTGAI